MTPLIAALVAEARAAGQNSRAVIGGVKSTSQNKPQADKRGSEVAEEPIAKRRR